jgi:hypothetical protein
MDKRNDPAGWRILQVHLQYLFEILLVGLDYKVGLARLEKRLIFWRYIS